MVAPVLAAAGAVATSTAAQVAGNALMQTVFNLAKNGMQVSSLADLTKPARVEPLAIIDSTLVDQPYMTSLLKLATSNFAGYYLQAVNMILGVGRIDTLKVLDSLNPDRTLGFDTAKMSSRSGSPSNESFAAAAYDPRVYANGLPSLESFSKRVRPNLLFSNEAFGDIVDGIADDAEKAGYGADTSKQDASVVAGDKVFEIENLMVGKLLNVEISDGTKSAKLPVLIRMIPAAVPPQSMVHMFSAGGRDSWAQRLFMVQTGQIKFWRDFVLGQDMIDEHFKALMNDKSGVFKMITDRRRNNSAKALQTGRVSIADASNVAIVSTETLKQATGKLFGKIEQESVRKAIFDNSYLLMLIVVDERWQRVQIWHRGVDLATTHKFDEIERTEKSKGPDITEMFKMFSRSMQTNL
ncbi:virion structural protein [Pseudomonas phage Psa21]|uniref:Virion structural protein n=1 Tax=Pseudomonas phage Psa21 TaxID=2530023 RepID=A0A481W5U0_9CAUD|nr:virion structural protein [Pseudomonas phage Psa21]QBJ02627.1 virion structural protein [Pseudomonas phage Psa21]